MLIGIKCFKYFYLPLCKYGAYKIFSTRTVDTFATCDFNFRMRKTAQCGPRLSHAMLRIS